MFYSVLAISQKKLYSLSSKISHSHKLDSYPTIKKYLSYSLISDMLKDKNKVLEGWIQKNSTIVIGSGLLRTIKTPLRGGYIYSNSWGIKGKGYVTIVQSYRKLQGHELRNVLNRSCM